MIELIYIGAIFSLLGCYMVAKGKSFYANLIWLFANPIVAYHNYCAGDYVQMCQWIVYMTFAAYGVIHLWSRRDDYREG